MFPERPDSEWALVGVSSSRVYSSNTIPDGVDLPLSSAIVEFVEGATLEPLPTAKEDTPRKAKRDDTPEKLPTEIKYVDTPRFAVLRDNSKRSSESWINKRKWVLKSSKIYPYL